MSRPKGKPRQVMWVWYLRASDMSWKYDMPVRDQQHDSDSESMPLHGANRMVARCLVPKPPPTQRTIIDWRSTDETVSDKRDG